MKLDWAMLADAAQVREGLAFVVGGGIDTVNTSALPAVLNASVLVRLLLHRAETEREHTMEIRINDEDGKELARATGMFGTGPGDLPIGWDVPAMFALNLSGLPLLREGRYSIEIFADGGHLKTLNLRTKVNPALAGGIPPTSFPPS